MQIYAFCVFLLLSTIAAQAAPSGHLAYLKDNAAYVASAATGKAVQLPHSQGAALIAMSPRDGSTAYFVTPKVVRANSQNEYYDGWISRPPYRSAAALPAPLNRANASSMRWSRNGKSLLVYESRFLGASLTGNKKWQRLPVWPDSASLNGDVVAYTTDKELRVRWPRTGKVRTLFSTARPEPLFDALKRGRNQKSLAELRQQIDPQLWRNSRNWAFGPAAITPDGKSIFFVANAGTSMGAQGNTTFALFVANVATGRLSVLSKTGIFFGRTPEMCEVSPDGRKLLFVSSTHSSAIENPSTAYVVELLTQKSVELIFDDPDARGKTNLTEGACWSPDSRYVAISINYYSTVQVLKSENWDALAKNFSVYIKDARTGRTIRKIKGAHQPSWSRR